MKIILLFLLLGVWGCNLQKKPDSTENLIFADVLLKKDGQKTIAEFRFYRDISEVVDGKEIKGFGKSPLVVDFPKINGAAMNEIKGENASKIYTAEIENGARDYAVTFSRKDGQYQSDIRLDPNDLSKPVKAEFKRKPADKN